MNVYNVPLFAISHSIYAKWINKGIKDIFGTTV